MHSRQLCLVHTWTNKVKLQKEMAGRLEYVKKEFEANIQVRLVTLFHVNFQGSCSMARNNEMLEVIVPHMPFTKREETFGLLVQTK